MSAKAVAGLALIAIAGCLTGGGVYAVHQLKQAKYDPRTLCSMEGSKAVSVILIDETDPFTEAEKTAARNLAAAEAASAGRGDRITVRLLKQREGADVTELGTAADLCNPGSEANPLFENPKRVALRYENAFREPLTQALENSANTAPAQTSPIAAAIQESVAAVPESPGQRLKLTLVTDLMEHTAEASAYTGTLSEAALRKAVLPPAQARLRGAEVRILLLSRPRFAKQQAAAVAVWRRLFLSVTEREPEFLRP